MFSFRSYKLLVVALSVALLFSSCHKSAYDGVRSTGHRTAVRTSDDGGKRTNRPSVKDEGWAKLDISLTKNDNKRLYAELKEWLGTPYKYAASDKGVGTDCSGMVMRVYQTVYSKDLQRNSARIYERNCTHVSRDKLTEGDLVFFNNGKTSNITHVGIYLKDNYFVHASSSRGVVVSSLLQRYYDTHYQCGGRVK